MNKLELVRELERVETRLEKFRENFRAVDSYYFQEGELRLYIETEDFKEKGTKENIIFTKELMRGYIKSEIEYLEAESQKILQRLVEAGN